MHEMLEQGIGSKMRVLPTQEDLESYDKAVSEMTESFFDIHILHGMMPKAQMKFPLSPPPAKARRIILATNVAESSLTVANVNVVIDTGLRSTSGILTGDSLV